MAISFAPLYDFLAGFATPADDALLKQLPKPIVDKDEKDEKEEKTQPQKDKLEKKTHTLFLTRKFKPYLTSELSVGYYEQGDCMPYHLDEYIMSSLIHEMTRGEIALCLSDQLFLLDRIKYYHQYWRVRLEADADADDDDDDTNKVVTLSAEDTTRYEKYYHEVLLWGSAEMPLI